MSRVQISFDPAESKTQQHFAKDADINSIVKRFGITGKVFAPIREPIGGDFADVPDFQTALNFVRDAEEQFMQMPADLRQRFNNDPGAMLAFLGDKSNRAEAVRLGLVKAPAEVDRQGEVVPPVEERKP